MIKTKVFQTSKKGEPEEDCQDAYETNDKRYRYAIADGATREFFSAKLAQELVKRFCLDNDNINLNILTNKEYEKWLHPIQENWKKYLEDIINTEKVNYVVKNRYNRKDSGASTFIGLKLNKSEYSFKAMIIGDSCLFHIRDNEILKCYLIDDDEIFDNSPDFFFSRPPSEMLVAREFIKPKIINEFFERGDYFLLATDAISKYLLTRKKNGTWGEIWNSLLKEDSNWHEEFIDKKRVDKDDRLDDDDVTTLIISTDNSNELFPLNPPKENKSNKNIKVNEKNKYKSTLSIYMNDSKEPLSKNEYALRIVAKEKDFDHCLTYKEWNIGKNSFYDIILSEIERIYENSCPEKCRCYKFSLEEKEGYFRKNNYFYFKMPDIYYKNKKELMEKIAMILDEY